MDPALPVREKTPPPTIEYSVTEYNPNIRIYYLCDHIEANRELAQLGSAPQALGFDLEWKPNFVKGRSENPVALVQLANNDAIYLLQISKMKEFPEKLKEILRNPRIIKAGVSVQNDAKKLFNDRKVSMYNCVELAYLAKSVDNAYWKGRYKDPLGLARLVAKYEVRQLPKGKITRSNWEANLDPLQIEYASGDAHAGYLIYTRLESMINLADPPESVWYSFNCVSGRLRDSRGKDWFPQNPRYDPGPPPPPRVPKEPKIATDQQQEKIEKVVPPPPPPPVPPPPAPPAPTITQDYKPKPTSSKQGLKQEEWPKKRRMIAEQAALSLSNQQEPSTSNSNVEYQNPSSAEPGTGRKITPHHHPYEGYRGNRSEAGDAAGSANAMSQQGPQRHSRRRTRRRGNKHSTDYDGMLDGMASLFESDSNTQGASSHASTSRAVHPMFSLGTTPRAMADNNSSNINNDRGRNSRPPIHANGNEDTTITGPYGDYIKRPRNH